MKTYIFEGVQDYGTPLNWGKFMVGVPDVEWFADSKVDPDSRQPLLDRLGWTQQHVWVMDLQTGEGAWFRAAPGASARADLEKHRIWVCPLFEEFLKWLYKQDMNMLHQQPGVIELPDAQFSINGYRRPGPHAVSFTLRQGDLVRLEWAGLEEGERDIRTVVCEGYAEAGEGVVIRSLTDDEVHALGAHTEAGIEAREEALTDDPERIWAGTDPADHPYPAGPASWPGRQALDETMVLSTDDTPTQIVPARIPGNGSTPE